MASIADGPVWCEACKRWFDSVGAYRRHRAACPCRAQLVENRP